MASNRTARRRTNPAPIVIAALGGVLILIALIALVGGDDGDDATAITLLDG